MNVSDGAVIRAADLKLDVVRCSVPDQIAHFPVQCFSILGQRDASNEIDGWFFGTGHAVDLFGLIRCIHQSGAQVDAPGADLCQPLCPLEIPVAFPEFRQGVCSMESGSKITCQLAKQCQLFSIMCAAGRDVHKYSPVMIIFVLHRMTQHHHVIMICRA